ncbi:MAG TPA: DciA family protein [Burkholderiaceae bacterium]|nr:DciA family protein [Burkholderiaceae bacterium]
MQRPPARRSHDDASPATLAVGWLGSDARGAQVLTVARNLLDVEQAIKAALPPALADVCKAARIERQQLTLAVPSAAYASKLRQLAPSLGRLLADGGWNLSEIIVKVQAGLMKTRTKTAPRQVTPLNESALRAFDELHRNIRPGPLADAISRLLKHHRQA